VTAAAQAVLDAVAGRVETEPEHVLPTLRLLADLDALPDRADTATIGLAGRLNAQRLTEAHDRFRAHTFATTEVRKILGGVSRQAVASRVANGSLLALEVAGRLRFPDWQFGPDGPVRGLPQVIEALTEPGRGVLAADALMRTPIEEAGGRSPAQLLAAGDLDGALHYIRVAGG